MTEQLKPCPFCGGEATLLHPEEEGEDYVIGCYNKCCGFPYERARDTDKQKVINAWNTRINALGMNKNETRALLKLLFSISESLKSVAAHYELEHAKLNEYLEDLGKENWYDEEFEEFAKKERLVNGES